MVILYADDDSDDRELFSQAVREIDPEIQIIEVENGLEAITSLATDILPDLIFLDVNMPLLNGDEALVQIRKDSRLKDLKVVMYSTRIDIKTIPDYIILNAAYVNKPTSYIDTVSTLKEVIGDEFPRYIFNDCM
jgi:CheY-like chemotaxis protein